MKKYTNIKPLAKIISLFTFLYIISLEALAQSSGFGAPSDSDMSVQFLGQIFGGLVGGGNDAFGSSIATFNSAVLIVGGILVGYTIFAGTLGTAHDGEMLGKKFSSVWVPIRTVLGTALVLPVMKGGYCTMQALVMWLVLQGISLANMVWSSYAGSAAASNLKPSISSNYQSGIDGYVYGIYAIAACVESHKQADEETKAKYGAVWKTDPVWQIWSIPTTGEDGVEVVNTKNYAGGDTQFGSGPGKKVCGEFFLPSAYVSTQENIGTGSQNQGNTNSLSSLNNLQKFNIKVDTSAISKAHETQSQAILTEVQKLATKATKDQEAEKTVGPALIKLVSTYEKAVQAAGQAQVAQVQNTLSEAAQTQGWFTAGTFATKIIMAQNEIQSAMYATGEAAPSSMKTENDLNATSKSTYRQYITNSRSWLPVWGDLDKGKQESGTNSNTSTIPGADESYSDKLLNSWKVKLVKWFTGVDFNKLQSDDRHPILIAQTMGNELISAAILLTTGSVGASAVAGLASAGFLNGAASALGSLLAFPVAMLMGVGGMLAYAIPMTPFFLWMGIVIGWTLMVVEAILAAPLWAVMHLHPYGDDMTGKGGQGYMLVLGLVVRPALIIFGLIAAITLSGLFGEYLNAIFLQGFSAPKSFGGVITTIMLAVIYTTILMNIIKTTFALMHQVPDQLLRWIGGGSEQLGQYASSFSQMAMEKAAGAAGAATGTALNAGQGAGRMLAEGMGHARKNEADKKNKQADSEAKLSESENQLDSIGLNPEEANVIAGDHARNGMSGAETGGAQISIGERKALANTFNQADSSGGLTKEASNEYLKLRSEVDENGKPSYTHAQAHAKSVQTAFDGKYGPGAAEKMGIVSKDGDGGFKLNQGALNSLGKNIGNHTESLRASGASVGQIDNAISGSIAGVQNGSANPMSELNSNLESSFANFKAENKQQTTPTNDPSGGKKEEVE